VYVGLMVVAALTDHRGKGYFVFKGGAEYVVLVAMVAVGVAAVGPGEWSVDHLVGWNLAGSWWAMVAVVGGALVALAFLSVSYRPSSAASTQQK
jgi:putative oxidoreductase